MTFLDKSGRPMRPSGDGTGKFEIKIATDPQRAIVILQVAQAKPIGLPVAQALALAHQINSQALSLLLKPEESEEPGGPEMPEMPGGVG